MREEMGMLPGVLGVLLCDTCKLFFFFIHGHFIRLLPDSSYTKGIIVTTEIFVKKIKNSRINTSFQKMLKC